MIQTPVTATVTDALDAAVRAADMRSTATIDRDAPIRSELDRCALNRCDHSTSRDCLAYLESIGARPSGRRGRATRFVEAVTRGAGAVLVGMTIVAGALVASSSSHSPATSSGTVELSAYSAPDEPGCVAAPITHAGDDQVYYCDQYAVDTIAPIDPVADCLVADGFHGRPDDHSETIYATSSAIEGCAALADHSAAADLDMTVAVELEGAPADLVACWLASGAQHDPVDGPDTLTASRLVIDSCNPLGWVGA